MYPFSVYLSVLVPSAALLLLAVGVYIWVWLDTKPKKQQPRKR